MMDYIRIACAVPKVKVGDVMQNARDICQFMQDADKEKVDLLVLPELALTGYTCGDLLFQDALWEGVKEGTKEILSQSKTCPRLTVVVGAPVRHENQLLNCAVVICNGAVQALIPKKYLPDYQEFNEKRWFASGGDLTDGVVTLDAPFGQVAMGTNLCLPLADGAILGVEVCEDLLAPIPQSAFLSLQGANVIVNLSASNELAGKQQFRRNLVANISGTSKCIYAYCSAGYTESTSDLVFSGHSMVAENGKILKESDTVPAAGYLLVQDCDVGLVRGERMRNTSFQDCVRFHGNKDALKVRLSSEPLRSDGALYPVSKYPFVPACPQDALARGKETFELQVTALAQRLSHLGAKAVLGISGGLDSTLALLVAAEAVKRLGRPKTDVHGITMPCFGTSDRTYKNAWRLMELLGITAKEIKIGDAVNLHFENIGHDSSVHNTTYENAQARERTQILMDHAGMVGGIVVGTGDLSELALGWCTYNGDHMSMYAVNCDVPKTLIPWVIKAAAQMEDFKSCAHVLQDILDTPISPELLPPDETGKILQQTEDLVGPYALHDFYLYYMVRYGFSPQKIYALARRAFAGEYEDAVIKKWLQVFYKRFFTQQFKRNCLPDGVKLGSVALGGKNDWKMPSDGCARLWLTQAENL